MSWCFTFGRSSPPDWALHAILIDEPVIQPQMPSGIDLVACKLMNARQVIVRVRYQVRLTIEQFCAITVVLLVENRAEVVVR